MRETVIVSNHVLKPAVVMEVELYSDEQIAAWDQVDRLEAGERATCQSALKNDPPSASKIDPPQRLVFV